MKELKEGIIEAVQDATDTVDGTVSIPILDHFLDGILADQCKIADARQQRELLATVVENFIGWRDKLHSEIRGGKLMFNVPKHYKWLDESELFTYYMDVARDSAIRPPLGLTPKKIHDEQVKVERFNEVRGAISRYYDAGLKIDKDWIEEYNELVECKKHSTEDC